MYRNGAFMRVYWEGAAIMLLADQRLRARTQGSQSLDTALDALAPMLPVSRDRVARTRSVQQAR